MEWVHAPAGAVRIDRNENPNGPAKEAIQAITLAAAESSRYPDELVMQLTRAVADAVGVAEFNVVLTCGSTDVIRSAVYSFTSPTRALITAGPSYESPGNDGSGDDGSRARPAEDGGGIEGGGARVSLQPEQPDGDRSLGRRRSHDDQ
jgi:hypothetical protein